MGGVLNLLPTAGTRGPHTQLLPPVHSPTRILPNTQHRPTVPTPVAPQAPTPRTGASCPWKAWSQQPRKPEAGDQPGRCRVVGDGRLDRPGVTLLAAVAPPAQHSLHMKDHVELQDKTPEAWLPSQPALGPQVSVLVTTICCEVTCAVFHSPPWPPPAWSPVGVAETPPAHGVAPPSSGEEAGMWPRPTHSLPVAVGFTF